VNYSVIHTYPNRYGLLRSGAIRCTRLFDTKEEAIADGEKRAKKAKCDLYIHNKNGTVEKVIRYETTSNGYY
jgi:hypothetical protein